MKSFVFTVTAISGAALLILAMILCWKGIHYAGALTMAMWGCLLLHTSYITDQIKEKP